MKRKRRTEITVETQRVVVIRQNRSVVPVWCAACAQHVTMLSAEEAAAATGLTRRTIYALVEAKKIHFTETPDGVLFVCFNSLTKEIQR